MFSNAIRSISDFTFPVIVSLRHESGHVEGVNATFVTVNADGWALTSAHVMEPAIAAKAHAEERQKYLQQVETLKNGAAHSRKKLRRLLATHRPNPRWITNLSYWWADDRVQLKQVILDPVSDLAAVRLDPPLPAPRFPTFWNPSREIPVGTSLCRLGFPFHSVTPVFNQGKGSFEFPPGTIPMPRFPNEGIHTRLCILKDEASGRSVKFLETSSPGLRGQSGGPLFDVAGTVCGVQSKTISLPLGFSPKAMTETGVVRESQFLNVGLATHVDEIVKFLSTNHINFNIDKK
jgi:hypothetical protein